MKIRSLLFSFLAIVVIFSLNSCSPKTKKIVIDNSKFMVVDGGTSIRPVENGEPGQNEFYNITYNLLWDVEVAMNGVDFGVIEGGKITDSIEVNDANNLKIEKFNILKNDAGLSVYYMDKQEKKYIDFNNPKIAGIKDMEKCEKDMKAMEEKFKKIEQAGGLLNDSWTWDVSYFENGNILWNKKREEEAAAKKKKK